jgi:hypothetical protein
MRRTPATTLARRTTVEITAEPVFEEEGVEVEEHARDHDARVIASAVSVGEVLNAIRTPGAASITMFTSASSIGVCAGSKRTPPPITTTSTGRRASAARAAALGRRPAARVDQQHLEVVPHRPDAHLLGLDLARGHVRVERLASEELGVQVNGVRVQSDAQHSPDRHLPLRCPPSPSTATAGLLGLTLIRRVHRSSPMVQSFCLTFSHCRVAPT